MAFLSYYSYTMVRNAHGMTQKKRSTRKKPSTPKWYFRLPRPLAALYKHRTAQILTSIVVGILMMMWTADFWNPIVFPPVKNPVYGVSFSAKRARELGIDPQANLTTLLDDMHIKNYRLMSYWDESEKTRGQLDFSELDWQINEIAKRGGTVSLGLGLRQPRWPECHEPDWAFRLKGDAWKQALYAYMEIVVKRYENNPTVISWQLENEAVNNWFGTCDPPDVQRLNEEFNLVKSWSSKPVWMSLSDQHGYPVNPPVPDRFGFSVYRIVWNEKIPPVTKNYLIYPAPIWYHRLRAAIIQLYTGRDIFIHELQLEPWGPVDTKDLSVDEQNKSMSPEQIHKNILFAREIGQKDIYVWGGEWWYWRKVHGDPSIWKAVRAALNET